MAKKKKIELPEYVGGLVQRKVAKKIYKTCKLARYEIVSDGQLMGEVYLPKDVVITGSKVILTVV